MSTTHLLINGGSDPEPSCPSSTGWIAMMVLFLLIAIGLAIWLIVLYARGDVGGNTTDRIVSLPGAKITANDNTVTGSWGTLDNENDKVTLYVSEKPFVFNPNGTVVTGSGVQQDSKTGSNGDVDVSVSRDTSYNAMLIATGDDTVHYRVFGPQKVFTQVTSDLVGRLFNIRDLNNCTGSVSEDATYTNLTSDVGFYRYGAGEANANASSKSFLINFEDEEDPDTETNMIICQIPGTTQVKLAEWGNKDSDVTAAPIICLPGTTDCNANTPATSRIPIDHCQWNYNISPPTGVAGENKWCLQAEQSLDLTNAAAKEAVCMSRNGSSLAMTSSLNSDTWFNNFFSLTPLNP